MERDPDCLFCRIVARELPATIIAEDEVTLAFMDINPAVDGHVLVIPKAHSRDVLEIGDDDLAAASRMVREVAARVKDVLGAGGVNVHNCAGAEAGQTVFHTHFHVIPRSAGDPLRLFWDPAPGDPDAIRATGERLVAGR
ncbi:MAG: HIT family protein [Baekduia sp.]